MVIAVPITITNTGAVVRFVNALKLRVTRPPDDRKREFDMFAEYDAFPARKIVIASGFAVPPKSSCTRLVGFISDRPEPLRLGRYNCSLTMLTDDALQTRERGVPFCVPVDKNGAQFIRQRGFFINYKAYFIH